jgi:S1-C subfamily serine protease
MNDNESNPELTNDAAGQSPPEAPFDPSSNPSSNPSSEQAEWAPPTAPYWHAEPQAQWPYAAGPYATAPQPPYWYAAPAPVAGPTRSRRALVLGGIGAALVAGGVAVAIAASSTIAINGNGLSAAGQSQTGSSGSSGTAGGSGSSGGSGSAGGGYGGYGSGGLPGGTNQSNGTGLASASAAQQVGVVDIDTVLKYQSAKAAGTGMVITSNGEILTNNHVVDGATSITVTVVATGKTYTATVVGTDPTDDVALLKIDATGLKTIKTSSSTVSVGAQVTGVGNAGGVGGVPSASPGTVTAVNQTITASDESGANAETLTGLIQTDAAIQAGDSGGPLFDSSDAVIGMDTAASASGNRTASVTSEGYAIPISKALALVAQMASGKASSTIHLGYPAFLGISVAGNAQTAGAPVAGVVAGLPAAQAGLVAGDVITGLGSATINSASDLTAAITTHKPGDKVSLTWSDANGGSHTATVTLVQGPAD